MLKDNLWYSVDNASDYQLHQCITSNNTNYILGAKTYYQPGRIMKLGSSKKLD